MDRKRSAPELNTNLALPFPPMSKANLKKALMSPIKMLPASLTSPTKAKATVDSPPKQEQPQDALIDPISMSLCDRVPTLHIQRASGAFQDPFTDHSPATWDCCACSTRNAISIHPGPHPLGALTCNCPHKPCSTCTTTGLVKPFLPIDEPAMVPCGPASTPSASAPHDAPDKELRFGIVCPSCGLSWRARESGKRFSKTLRKMPSVSLKRAAHLAPEGRLRKSRSTLVLGNKRIVTPPGAAMPKQAEYAAVWFSGVECTCGVVVGLASALCFQILGEQVDSRQKEGMALWAREGWSVGWTSTPELREKGHGTPTLRLGKVEGGDGDWEWKVEHPNPLKSSPVVDKMARDSWEEKCDREGWV